MQALKYLLTCWASRGMHEARLLLLTVQIKVLSSESGDRCPAVFCEFHFFCCTLNGSSGFGIMMSIAQA